MIAEYDYKFICGLLPDLTARVNFNGNPFNTIISRRQLDVNILVTMVNGCGFLSIWNSYSYNYYEDNVIICNYSSYDDEGGRAFRQQNAKEKRRVTSHGEVRRQRIF